MVEKQYHIHTNNENWFATNKPSILKNKLTQHHIIKLRKNFVSQLYESFALTQQTFCER
jgi:hypothetical protein